jgi:hypothetical protein
MDNGFESQSRPALRLGLVTILHGSPPSAAKYLMFNRRFFEPAGWRAQKSDD